LPKHEILMNFKIEFNLSYILLENKVINYIVSEIQFNIYLNTNYYNYIELKVHFFLL